MAPTISQKKSKSTKNGRVLKKLDEVLRVCSKLSDEQQLIHKKIKKIFRLLEESRNPPAQPSADFQQASCSCRSSESSGLRRLQLSFECKLPSEIFTADLIYAIDDGTKKNVPVRVVLVDEGHNVVNEGLLSSLKLDVFVAYGNFKAEEEESEGWTTKELETSRVPARKEVGSLLLGSCGGTMVKGICTFNDLKFGDNSSWVPSRTFRLVAKVAESARISDMVEVKPAVSKPIRVRDQRGKQYEKRSVPSQDDEVWRIRRIGKDGPYHKRLEAEGVRTVGEFLRRYYMDQSSLRKILGTKDGAWATIVEHVKECNPNNEGFQYASHESKAKLLFDCFYKLVGVSFDDQSYHRLQDLTEDDKSQVEQLRLRAFEDRTKLVRINSLLGCTSAKTNPGMVPDPNPQHSVDPPPQQVESTMEEYVPELEGVPQESIWANIAEDQPEENMNFGYPVSSASVSHPCLGEQSHHLTDAPMNDQVTQVERSIGDQATELPNDEPFWIPDVPLSASGRVTEEHDMFHVSWFMPDAFD